MLHTDSKAAELSNAHWPQLPLVTHPRRHEFIAQANLSSYSTIAARSLPSHKYPPQCLPGSNTFTWISGKYLGSNMSYTQRETPVGGATILAM